MVSIFTYGFPLADDAFTKANIKLLSLTNYNALIEVAHEQKLINAEDDEMLLSWRDNPSEWTGAKK
jgi:orotate phosphoribosyltransferase